jgi:hypothetical protein
MVTAAAARENPGTYGQLPVTLSAVAAHIMAANLGGHCALGEQVGNAPFDRTCWPECAFKVLGLPCLLRNGTLQQQDLLNEIGRNRRPPILWLLRSDGSSHVILLTGYAIFHDGTVVFDVCDPMYEGITTANFYQLGVYETTYAQTATWQHTYIDVGPALHLD